MVIAGIPPGASRHLALGSNITRTIGISTAIGMAIAIAIGADITKAAAIGGVAFGSRFEPDAVLIRERPRALLAGVFLYGPEERENSPLPGSMRATTSSCLTK